MWRKLNRLVDEGKAKKIGVSNFTIDHLQQLIDFCDGEKDLRRPEFNQIEIHPLNYEASLIDYCRKQGIQLMSYCPLAKGQVLTELKSEQASAIVLKWHLKEGFIPIVHSESEQHMRENFMMEVDSSILAAGMELCYKLTKNEALQKKVCWDPKDIT